MDENYKTLGDIPKIKRNIRIWDKRFVKALHFFIYHKSGGRDCRARIRGFSGFHFNTSDEQFKDKVKVVRGKLSTSDLVSICAILDIPNDSKNLIKHIFNHLIAGRLLKYDHQGDSDDASGDDVSEVKENANNENKTGGKEEGNKNSGKEQEKTDGLDEDVRDLKGIPDIDNPIFKHISDFVKPFRGCNDYPIECWLKDFEDAAAALQLKEWQKLILARNSLKGLAKSLIEERGVSKWDELKTILINEFRSKMTGKALHETLKGRTKRRNESLLQYYKQMKVIADQGSLGDLDLIDYVIEGTPDDPWKVVLYGAKSLNHFRQKLRDYDFLAKRHERMRSSTLEASSRNTEEEGDEGVSRATGIPEHDTLHCLRCKKEANMTFDCMEKPAGLRCCKCYRCGDLSNDCESGFEDMRYVRENFNGLPKKEVFLKGKRLYAMIDSGSQLNLINAASHRRIGSPNLKATILFLRGFGKAKVPPKGYFEDIVQIDGYSFNTRFYVVGDDVLKRDVIIGSTLLQQAEFTFRRNEILIRKVENQGQCTPNPAVKNVKRCSFRGHCTCVGRNTEPSVIQKPEEVARSDEGTNHDRNLQRVVDEQQTIISDLQNAVKNEKEKALEYQRKFKSAEEYFTNLGLVNNQANRKPADRPETSKTPQSNAKVKNDEGSRIIFVEEDKKENECKLIREESEEMEELQKKCAILEKSLIELTKDCNRLRRENKTVVNLLSEEKLKRKKLTDKFRDCRLPKKG